MVDKGSASLENRDHVTMPSEYSSNLAAYSRCRCELHCRRGIGLDPKVWRSEAEARNSESLGHAVRHNHADLQAVPHEDHIKDRVYVDADARQTIRQRCH